MALFAELTAVWHIVQNAKEVQVFGGFWLDSETQNRTTPHFYTHDHAVNQDRAGGLENALTVS
jgi:hypothetical protein